MIEAKDLIGDEITKKFSRDNILSNLNRIENLYQEEGLRAIEDNLTFLRDLTRIIFGIDINDENLIIIWENILKAHLNLKREGQVVDMRVVAFDHFVNGNVISNPKIMELENFKNFIDLIYQDPKTFTYNYLLLKTIVNYEIERINRYGGYFSIILIDIDNFKYYNDTLGHKVGDELLSEFSRVVISNLRRSDILFRYGGDEFVILCPETRRIGARVVAEKIRDGIKKHFSSRNIEISVSGGVAVFPYDGNTFEELLEFADKLLYYSKSRGKNIITDKFDSPLEDDKRMFPRFPLEYNEVIIKCNDSEIKGRIRDISKSGMFIEVKIPNINLYKTNEVYLSKVKLNGGEYIFDIPIKLVRVSEDGIGIDFSSNKSLEVLVYLFTNY